MQNHLLGRKQYLLASDFDQTLSFNDSGQVLAEMMGIPNYQQKVAGLTRSNLVQQGAELAYLLRHDPQFRSVRREHLLEAGRRVRLKDDIQLFTNLLQRDWDGVRFRFCVISAAPREVVQSALDGIVRPENVFGTEFGYEPATGEICDVLRAAAGYGKIAVLEELEGKLQVTPDHTIYVGDGSSDLYVMHHVNSRAGHTIAVSETQSIGRIARRTVLSASALAVLLPILEDILKWDADRIRDCLAAYGLGLQGWDKIRMDCLTFNRAPIPLVAGEPSAAAS
jgi:2-hydroxy-3-keto-5-methylthiopentenyl-1-phosphate phosphatase